MRSANFGVVLLDIGAVSAALIESAALYSLVSLVLFITFFATPDVGYPACANVFTVFIVSFPELPHSCMVMLI